VALGMVAALTGCSQHTASTETEFTQTLAYYTVRGTTAADLDAALSRGGPLVKDTGMRHPGATEMKFGGSVTYAETPELCAVDSALITLDTKIILPRWTQRRRAERDLALIWDTLSGDIRRHEERHAEIARQYARKLQDAIAALRPQPTCGAMEQRVAEVTERILGEHDQDQARFDRVEALNFEKRMVRLLENRLETIAAASGN
jgi:predicted secreted Zn-dependent protease